ncbi:MAG: AbrB/MazE/SpoVT family DNA-binding domain-containing protein [Candidatus Bathyarchaeia archaeon]
MVRLKLKVGPKGQIVLPKLVRETLGVKPRGYVIADFRDEGLVIVKGLDVEELIGWLRKTRKPVAEDVSRFNIEEEVLP